MPDQLLDRLHAVRRRMRQVRALAGAGQVVIALVVLVAAYFAIDFFITSRIFPSGRADFLARLVLLIACATAWLRLAYARFLVPVLKKYTDDDMAMLVERRHPELRGRLISTVQLTRAGASAAGRYQGSPQMIAALDEQTRSVAAHLEFSDIIDLAIFRRAALLAALLCILAVGLALWQRPYAAALFKRMALMPADYPTAARIITYTRGGNLVAGRPFTVRVKLDPGRYVPATVHVRVNPKKNRPYRLVLRRVAGPPGTALFRGIIHNTLSAFTYRIRAYDARTPWQAVHIWSRPGVKAMTITCIYPAYVHRSENTTRGGDVVVPAGTVLKINASLVSACRAAAITLRMRAKPAVARRSGSRPKKQMTRPPLIARVLPMRLTANGTEAQCEWTARRSGVFYVHLTDAHALTNVDPTMHIVQAMPDRPPVARIAFPRRTETATPFAAWPIRFSVSDDYGLTAAFLVYRVRRPSVAAAAAGLPHHAGAVKAGIKTGKPGVVIRPSGGSARYGPLHKIAVPGVAGAHLRQLKNGKMMLNFSGLHVAPGCRVQYWIKAVDNHQPKAHSGMSRRLRFRIEDPALVAARLARQTREVLRSLHKVRRRSGKVAQGIRRLSRQLAGKTPRPKK